MKTENLAAWGRGLLPPTPTENQYRAAMLILSVPIPEEMPPEKDFSRGPMHPDYGAPNPEREKWWQDFLERVRALCVWHGIKPTLSGEIDWIGVAFHLIRHYVPKHKGEPRIKLNRKRGAKPKHGSWPAKAARQRLLEIVAQKRSKNPHLSVARIASDLVGKRVLPELFRHVGYDSLRKHIARAEDEAARDHETQRMMSDLHRLFHPGEEFIESPLGLSGLGLSTRPPSGSNSVG